MESNSVKNNSIKTIHKISKSNNQTIKKELTMQIQNSYLKIKSYTQDGEISGYASIFNNPDMHFDVICNQAFNSAESDAKDGKFPKFLWQHDSKIPIGFWTIIRQDQYGLFVQGNLLLELQQAKEAFSMIKNNIIDGLSVGFWVKKEHWQGGKRYITEVDLQEISLVTFPACRDAKILSLKNLKHEKPPPHLENNYENWNENDAAQIFIKKDENNMEKSANQVENLHSNLSNCVGNLSGANVNSCLENCSVGNCDGNLCHCALQKLNHKAKNFISNNSSNFQHNNPQHNLQHNNSQYNNLQNDLSLSAPLSMQQKSFHDFSKFLRSGDEEYLQKSLSGIDENGSLFLPKPIVRCVFDQLQNLTTIRSLCAPLTISENSIEILIDSKLPNAGWANDEIANETDTPELKKINIQVHEIYAKPRTTQKLLDDAKINIENWIIQKISEKFAILENQAFILGDGQGKPKGFLSYRTDDQASLECLQHIKTGIKAGFNEQKAADTLIDTVCALKPEYLSKAVWIMSAATFAVIRKIKNNKTNEYILNNNQIHNDANNSCKFANLLGYPVIIDNNMPNIAEDSCSIAFGDFEKGYQIIDRNSIGILRDPYTYKPFVEFYVTKRVGGDVIDFEAIKVVKFA